jgi:hypothetical protein
MLTLRHTGFYSPVHRDQLDYTVYEDGRAIGRSRSGIRGRTMWNDNDRRIVLTRLSGDFRCPTCFNIPWN